MEVWCDANSILEDCPEEEEEEEERMGVGRWGKKTHKKVVWHARGHSTLLAAAAHSPVQQTREPTEQSKWPSLSRTRRTRMQS